MRRNPFSWASLHWRCRQRLLRRRCRLPSLMFALLCYFSPTPSPLRAGLVCLHRNFWLLGNTARWFSLAQCYRGSCCGSTWGIFRRKQPRTTTLRPSRALCLLLELLFCGRFSGIAALCIFSRGLAIKRWQWVRLCWLGFRKNEVPSRSGRAQ